MKTQHTILLALATALLFSACGGPKGTRVTQGTGPAGPVASRTLYADRPASIVHVDFSGRLATIRNGTKFEPGAFLIVKDSNDGEQTGVLKALPQRVTGLRTADVLEGRPGINDLVTPASPPEAKRLGKIYRDAEEQ